MGNLKVCLFIFYSQPLITVFLTVSCTHMTLKLKSCAARPSQKPSRANLEAAYTSLNATPVKNKAYM